MRNPSGHPLVAATLDFTMRPLQRLRSKVVPRAAGHVLEIGVGTGLNAALYDPTRVLDLVGIEPDPHMLRRATPRYDALRSTSDGIAVELLQVGAEALPFEADRFDAIVVTFVLCTIPCVEDALREMHRVLAPDGVLHFAEHTRSDHRVMAGLQDLLNPVWGVFAGGCHLNRDALALLGDAGFALGEVHGHGRGPLGLTPVHRGTARKA
ncbi:MAG: class I SAM-dependent methyltransferase [Myxococcota bacterium]